MTDTIEARIAFPGLDDPTAGTRAQELLSELRQDAELLPHLDRTRTAVARDDATAMDFGVTLIAVLGTPAIIILAKAIRDWAERTGTEVEVNGMHIRNARSQDLAAIAKALQPPEDQKSGKPPGGEKRGAKTAVADDADPPPAKPRGKAGGATAKPGGKRK